MGVREHRRVAALIRRTVDDATDLAAFREVLLALLTRSGRVLASPGEAKWPALVVGVCRALGGAPDAAVGAAAAVEFVVAAADVVDDLVDDEWESATISAQRALNASLALPWLAQRRAAALAPVVGSACAGRIGELLADGYLAAAAGEDLDLVFGRLPATTEEAAHDMTCRKSGSLVAIACQIGAAAAAAGPEELALAGRFGSHIGIASQLLNDLVGVDPDAPLRGSDLRLRKKTLPIAYALRCAREEGLAHLVEWASGATPLAAAEEQQLAATIHGLGAAHYTWVVAEAHRREALAAARTLAERAGRQASSRALRRLVPAVPLRIGDATA